MRFVSWNIRHGAGKSAGRIVQQLRTWNPDVVGLQEFRGSRPSQQVADGLRDLGLIHQVQTVDETHTRTNGLLLASRFAFAQQPSTGMLHEANRWLHVVLSPPHHLHVMVMHVPNRSEGDKYGIHDEIVATFERIRDVPAIAFGDTNTGVPGIDEESAYFNRREGQWFSNIQSAGWQDVWRTRNPSVREFTWYHHSGNGFRLDQLFASPLACPQLSNVRYNWGEKLNDQSCSDHAAMLFDFDA